MFFKQENYKVEVAGKYKHFSDKEKALKYFMSNKYKGGSVILYELIDGDYIPIERWIDERSIMFNKFND